MPADTTITTTNTNTPAYTGPDRKTANKGQDWAQEARQLLEEHRDADLEARGGKFTVSPGQLNALVDPKNAHVLKELGGMEGLARALDVDLDSGLTSAQYSTAGAGSDDERVAAYGRNVLPEKKSKSLLQLMWIAFQDKVLIILSIAAIISLALGLYETFGQPPEHDSEGNEIPQLEWVEGVAIIVAVLIVVVVGAANDWQKERQFVKLNKKKEDRKVKVIRDGAPTEISVFDILVGDLLMAEPGEMIPADGVLVHGFDLKCDESSASGESATMKKHPASEVMEVLENDAYLEPTAKPLDAFMLSGAKVLEGTGVYIAVAVGPHSMYGRTLMSLQEEAEVTPLQEKLNNIAEGIARFGIGAAIVLFVALFIRFCAQLPGSTLTPAQKGSRFLTVFITAVTIVVVAVPEGLPLAVTLALAFATTRMVKDNNLVRVLKACETMGGATTVCSDKTGTLTQNKMSVVKGTFGRDTSFTIDHAAGDADAAVDGPSTALDKLGEDKFQILFDSIALNSSAFENTHPEEAENEPFVGSKTETALLGFARKYMKLGNLAEYRRQAPVAKVFPFDSAKKFMATIVNHPSGQGYRLFVKGASEVVLGQCTQIFDPATGNVRDITKDDVEVLRAQIDRYAEQSLRTIGIVYRDVDESVWNPNKDDQNALLKDFTFFGVVGIMDPLRPGVPKAVADCREAGVVVRMVTGDNLKTARAIALDCGILTPGLEDEEIVMEGPQFRKLSPIELKEVVPRLRVLARSSPQDKRNLVKYLKARDETVAVTGDGTNDAPALKLADVGFSMGIAGTEVAKEASEIILMDDNFSSIVKAIMWGRTVNDAVKKFLQFQLTVNVTAVVLTFVSAVADSENASVLTAVQLLWVNLIMDSFAALALATDPPSPSVLQRKPDNRKTGLITVTMWKMIFGQSIFQLIVTFTLHFAGFKIFHFDPSNSRDKEEMAAMVFNTFVWLQFFNMFVNRRLDNKQNIFEGFWRNKFFIGIALLIVGIQIMIMFVGGAAFSIVRQPGRLWAVAIICGLVSLPCGAFLRTIPDAWVAKLYPAWLDKIVKTVTFQRKKKRDIDSEMTVGYEYRWNPAIEHVRNELQFLKKVRGGRLSALKFRTTDMFARKSVSPSPSPLASPSVSDGSASPTSTVAPNSPYLTGQGNLGPYLTVPGTPSRGPNMRRRSSDTSGSSIAALTMVPVVVSGAIGGWSPEPIIPNEQEDGGDDRS